MPADLRDLTDAERAEFFRKRVTEAYAEVAAVLDDARLQGFEIAVNAGPGPDGKIVILSMKVMKVL